MTQPEPDVVSVVLGRRSVRSGYLTQSIPREVLVEVVRCGLAAPASKAASPWRFTVVDQRDRLIELADDVAAAPGAATYTPHSPSTGRPVSPWTSTVDDSADVLRSVPAAIFIENRGPFSGGRRALLQAAPEAQALAIVGYELEFAGLGAALQNMWLAALAFGLSGVFMGDVAVAERALRERLCIDGDLLGALALGYVSESEQGPSLSPALDPDLVRWDDHPS